jgi:hypothetical protein
VAEGSTKSRRGKSAATGASAGASSAADRAAPKAEEKPAAEPEMVQDAQGGAEAPTGDAGETRTAAEPLSEPLPEVEPEVEPDPPEPATLSVAAAPLEPPAALAGVQPPDPETGYAESSTNPVAAAAALRTVPGDDHIDLIDDNGDPVNPEELFDDPGAHSTIVRVNRRVIERFTYRGAARPATRLYLRPGQVVSRAEAERIKAAHALPPQEPMSQSRPRP